MPERFDQRFSTSSLQPAMTSTVMARRRVRSKAWQQALRPRAREPPSAVAADQTLEWRRNVEIVCVERPGAGSPLRRQPQFAYFIAPETAADPGDGTEATPWPDLETALARSGELHDAGDDARRLRPGDRLQLTRREVFAASPIERRKRLVDQIAKIVLAVVTAALVLPLLAILAYLLVKAWPALSWSFLLENPQNYMTAGGIWAPLVGTFYLVLISLALAAPIGVLAGVYLNEYAGDNWLTRMVNLAVVNLAGVPSIVHALFGVGAFVLFAGMGRSVLAASCTLAIMTLPVIITSTREALAAVPQSFREACWNMGASRWQTIRTIVLPNSISGILTGVILQVSRAAGETAPILFTGAVFYVAVPDHGIGVGASRTVCSTVAWRCRITSSRSRRRSPASPRACSTARPSC